MKASFNLKKLIYALMGYLIMSVGINAFYKSTLGSDPISLFYDGVHNILNTSYGNAAIIVNVTGLIIVLFAAKKYFNVGTVLNAIILGVFINLTSNLIPVAPAAKLVKLIYVIIGIILLSIGNGLVISTDLGYPWVDALATLISKKLNKKYSTIRIAFDALFAVSGYAMGGVFNIATILAVLNLGLLIEFFANLFKRKIVFTAVK